MNQAGASCLREALALNLLLHCSWGLWVALALCWGGWAGGALYREAGVPGGFSSMCLSSQPGMEPGVEPVLQVSASTNAKHSHALPSTLLRSSRAAPEVLSTASSPKACQVGGWWWRSRSPALPTVVVWQETPGDLPGLSCPVFLQRIFWLQMN